MSRATELLQQEHNSIRTMLDFSESVAGRMSRGEPAPPEVLGKVTEFIRLYVDQSHHNKEEDALFPALEQKGFSTAGGPLGVMLMEHDRARSLIQELNEASESYGGGEQDSGERWIQALFDYSQLMHDHFGKEEEMLFRMADNALSAEEQAAIALDFERIEREKLGPGRHEQLSAMMTDLISRKKNGGI